MKFWYFRFEGKFTEQSENCGDGVFSSCLVPESNFRRAKTIFEGALPGKRIVLTEVIEYFSVDGEALDPTDEVNNFWITWYNKTKREGELSFEVFHVFALDSGRD